MPETTPTPDSQTDEQSSDSTADLGEAGKKALREERARANKAEKKAAELQQALDAANAAQLSELERAQKAAADATARAEKAEADAMRAGIAAEYGIGADDAALFLTSNDEDTLRRAAERLAAKAADEKKTPKPDASQGKGKDDGNLSNEDRFAAWLDDSMNA